MALSSLCKRAGQVRHILQLVCCWEQQHLQRMEIYNIMSGHQLLTRNVFYQRRHCRQKIWHHETIQNLKHVRSLLLRITPGKSSVCGRVYDESWLKDMLIAVLLHSCCFYMRNDLSTNKDAILQAWTRDATLLFMLCANSDITNIARHTDNLVLQVLLRNKNRRNQRAAMVPFHNKRSSRLLSSFQETRSESLRCSRRQLHTLLKSILRQRVASTSQNDQTTQQYASRYTENSGYSLLFLDTGGA